MTMETTAGGIEGSRRQSNLEGLLARLSQHGGALAALTIRLVAAALGYMLQIGLARALGAEGYGVFAYAWAFVAIGGFTCTFGLSQTAVRHLASYSGENRSDLAVGFMRLSVGVVAIGSFAFALVGYAVLTVIPAIAPGAMHVPVLLALAAIPFFALGDLAEGFARSQGWTGLALAPPYLLRPLLILVALPLFWLWSADFSAANAMTAALSATAITGLAQCALVWLRLRNAFAGTRTATYRSWKWLHAALPVLAGDLVHVVRQNIDVILLAYFAPPAVVGAYFAATRIASLLGLVEFAVGAAAAHRFAGAGDEAADSKPLSFLAGEAAAMTFWPTALAAGVLVLIAPMLLSLFGGDFATSAPLSTILALGALARAWVGPCDDLLVMRGHGGEVFLAQLASLVVMVGFLGALAPFFGATGVAIGAALSQLAAACALASAARRKLGFAPNPLQISILSRG